jgi:hypothetical protein
MLSWPLAWLLLVPVVLVETLVARRLLAGELRHLVKCVLVANLWSTLAGIPLAYAFYFALVVASDLTQPLVTAMAWSPLTTVFQAEQALARVAVYGPAWRGSDVLVPLALAFTQIPAFFVSVLVEYAVVRRRVPPEERDRVKLWAWRANETSYGLLLVLLFPSPAGFAIPLWLRLGSVTALGAALLAAGCWGTRGARVMGDAPK